jgi:hypothetical protein
MMTTTEDMAMTTDGMLGSCDHTWDLDLGGIWPAHGGAWQIEVCTACRLCRISRTMCGQTVAVWYSDLHPTSIGLPDEPDREDMWMRGITPAAVRLVWRR